MMSLMYNSTRSVLRYFLQTTSAKPTTPLIPSSMSESTIPTEAAGQPSILSDLTFGIEFEFLAYAPDNVNPQRAAMKALNRPVQVQCDKCPQIHSFMLPVEDSIDNPRPFQLWTSHNDVSIVPETNEAGHIPEECRFYPLELVSRILNFTKPTPDPIGQIYPCTGEPYEWSAQTEVAAVLQRLTECFSRPGFLLCNNRSTGLHTHWGNGQERPPVQTSIGMFGVFTALERHFDALLPVSRICSQGVRGPSLGINRPNPLYSYSEIKENLYVGSTSKVFLEDFARTIRGAMDLESEEETRATIYEALRNCNAPAWLESMSAHDSIDDFLDSWPPTQGRGRATLSQRSIAVNLTNLQRFNGSKGTIEVRATPGSSDIDEVWAWCDFMGKLVLWLSTPGIQHKDIIIGIWANPHSSIFDLLTQVGVSQSTFDFYTDRMDRNWAAERFNRLATNLKGNPFKHFIRAVENNRYEDCRRFHVDAKIQEKLEQGLYGQHPDAFLQVMLPSELYYHPESLNLNMNKCDLKSRTDEIIEDAKALAAAKSEVSPRKLYVWVPPRGDDSGSGSPTSASLVPPPLFARPSVPQRTPDIPSDLEDPFTTTSPTSTPSRPAGPIPTVRDLADIIQHQTNVDRHAAMEIDSEWDSSLSAGTPTRSPRASPAQSEDFPFRATNDAERTYAQQVPEGAASDSEARSPESAPRTPDNRFEAYDSDSMDESV